MLKFRHLVHPVKTTFNKVRYFYSDELLGIDAYKKARQRIEKVEKSHTFFKKHMEKRLLHPNYELRHLEKNLQTLLHVATVNDMEILESALHQLIQKRETYKGFKCDFGNAVMRTFHFLKMPKEALKCFNNNNLCQLITRPDGYFILLDLLYESMEYDDDVLRICYQLKSNGTLQKSIDRKLIDAIILATLYRMNTADAYHKALELWNSFTEVQLRASRTFVAAFAVNQKQPQTALDIMNGEGMYMISRHIKLMAWAQTGQLNEIFKMLKSNIDFIKQENGKIKCKLSFEVLAIIEKLVQQRGSIEDKNSFHNIQHQLKSLDSITMKSFNEVICNCFYSENLDKNRTQNSR